MLKNLKMLRESAGISQKQLADAVGISQQSVNKYENHKIEPDISTMIRIADYFDTTVDFLIGNSIMRRKTDSIEAGGLSQDETVLVNQYRQLSAKQQDCILRLMESYEC